MQISPLIDQLIDALQVLPGIGPRSAQRVTLHLLRHNRSGGENLAKVLAEAMAKVGYCRRCRTFAETDLCTICTNPKRDPSLLCIVESAADILAIEQAAGFRGGYFVLHGRLSPMDGIGPEDLGIDRLVARVDAEAVEEVILATNPTVEGEATAHYLHEVLKDRGVRMSRIAHGVPVGGELEYTDGTTIAHALQGRRDIGTDG